MTRIPTLATALVLLATSAQATTVTWPFAGCEAADVAALAAVHEPAWQGETHAMGPWSLRHEANLDCTTGECSAALTMTMDHADEAAPDGHLAEAPFAFTWVEERRAHALTLEGDAARGLLAHLGPASFEKDGATRRVMMDYGRLADALKLRIRTEITCTADGDRCTIQADPIAYIAYDDRQRCGAIAAAMAPTN